MTGNASVERVVLLALVLTAIVAGCGGSAPKGPPDLLFVSTRDGDYAIFGGDTDGGHVRRLTEERGDPATPQGLFFQVEPTWSPDGRRIAFASRRQGIFHIYVMNADGTGTTRLTSGKRNDNTPSWSPDGTQIVFSREGALFVVPARGGKPHRVGRGFGNAADPAWSPDGERIAFDYRKPGFPQRELYVMRADGSGIRQLTKLRRTSALPAWSPDGKRIAFQSNGNLGRFEIYTIAVDGTDVRRVTRSLVDVIQPAWAPDGRLGFSRDGAIWVDDDGRQSRLTSDENNSDPTWRPAGQEPE